jgi:histidinol-phosphate aminotransferase
MLERVDELRETRAGLEEWLRLHGFDVVPSQSNFLLFGRFTDRHDVFTRLLDQGVLVREVGPEGFLRVCAGTPAETDAFRKAILTILPRIGLAPSDTRDQVGTKRRVREESR